MSISITFNTIQPDAVYAFCNQLNPFDPYYFDIHSMSDLLKHDGTGQTAEIYDDFGALVGIVLFEIVNHVGGRELEIKEVAFEPVTGVSWTREVWPHLFELAWKHFNCDRIGITSEKESMTRLMKQNGFKVLTTTMVLEIDANVRQQTIQ
jgi:hypothetical protein